MKQVLLSRGDTGLVVTCPHCDWERYFATNYFNREVKRMICPKCFRSAEINHTEAERIAEEIRALKKLA